MDISSLVTENNSDEKRDVIKKLIMAEDDRKKTGSILRVHVETFDGK